MPEKEGSGTCTLQNRKLLLQWLSHVVVDDSDSVDTAMARLLEQAARDASDPITVIELYETAREQGVATPAHCGPMLTVMAQHESMKQPEHLHIVMGVLRELWDAGGSPGWEAYIALLHACRNAGCPADAVRVLSAMREEGLDMTGVPFKHLVAMSARLGDIESAFKVTDVLEESGYLQEFHIHGYNSIISALGKKGRMEEALEVYEGLRAKGITRVILILTLTLSLTLILTLILILTLTVRPLAASWDLQCAP